jgi:hypothetical protein
VQQVTKDLQVLQDQLEKSVQQVQLAHKGSKVFKVLKVTRER